MFTDMFGDMSLNRNEAITVICVLVCMVVAAYFIAGILKGEVNINVNPSDLNVARFGGF